MTIGDDGVASICMGKEHTGDPCKKCGHASEQLNMPPNTIYIEPFHIATANIRKYGTYYLTNDSTSLSYVKSAHFGNMMVIIQRAAGEPCHRAEYGWDGSCERNGGHDQHYMCASCLAKKFLKDNNETKSYS